MFSDELIDPEVREMVDEIARAAVIYGFLRGIEGASGTGTWRVAASPLLSGTEQSTQRLARQAAEEFLIKVHVERVTGS